MLSLLSVWPMPLFVGVSILVATCVLGRAIWRWTDARFPSSD